MSPVADKGIVIFHVGGHDQGALYRSTRSPAT
jgi:hypothetical protein